MLTQTNINLTERDLQRLLCMKPELLEADLMVIHEEYPIRGLNSTYRCDLYCVDQKEVNVFVELKLTAGKDVVYQIAKYKTLSETEKNARFIVAALQFEPETKLVLDNFGFETVLLDKEEIIAHLSKEQSNPQLYIRKTIKKLHPPKISRPLKDDTPDDEAEEINHEFLQKLKDNLDEEFLNGFHIEGIGFVRKKYNLFLQSDSHPDDKIVIYHRRKNREIHIIYSPDYSPQTGRKDKQRVDSSEIDKKTEFHRFVLDKANPLSTSFQLPLFESKQRKKTSEPNRLEITHQAWKGLSRVYTTPTSRWTEADFIEMVSRDLYDFIENIHPFIEEFYSYYNHLLTKTDN